MSDPYIGKYNFVGGKVENGEDDLSAAYRELQEETGITREDIHLYQFMDIKYYQQKFILEMFVGMLHKDIALREEKNPLVCLAVVANLESQGKTRIIPEKPMKDGENLYMQLVVPEMTP